MYLFICNNNEMSNLWSAQSVIHFRWKYRWDHCVWSMFILGTTASYKHKESDKICSGETDIIIMCTTCPQNTWNCSAQVKRGPMAQLRLNTEYGHFFPILFKYNFIILIFNVSQDCVFFPVYLHNGHIHVSTFNVFPLWAYDVGCFARL